MWPHLPLKDRVLKASSKPVCIAHPLDRPSTYRNWSKESLSGALEAVAKGTSVRRAAEEHGIPKSTLWDHVSGRVLPGAHSGPPRYLTTEEEDELEHFLFGSAAIGYPRSRMEVMALVGNKIGKPVSNGWWESFCKRHPMITLRTGAPLSKARAMASDPSCINEYFDILEETLCDNNLIDKPQAVFNMDESGVPLCPQGQKGIHKLGSRNPVIITSGDKTQITIVGCVSAAGYCLPPMVIWDRKTLAPSLTVGEVPGTVYGLSPKGWMDQELFDLWFTTHFLKYAPSSRPLLLIMDGHSSHYCPQTIRFAAEHEVILFTLPPNTTHITQPLDKGCFGPFKTAWKESVHKYMVENPGKVVTRYNFSTLFCEAWMKSMTVKNILSAFKIAGIQPFDRNAVRIPQKPKSPLATASGIKYIPLFTPSKRSQPRQFQAEVASSSSSSASGSTEDIVQMPEFESSSDDDRVIMPPPRAALGLKIPSLSYKTKQHQAKQSSRVLTSRENLEALEEKQKKKEEAMQRKAERKRQHEERKEEKEMKKQQKTKKASGNFTAKEIELFTKRYDNGYDLKTDGRYNQWLQVYDVSSNRVNSKFHERD